MNIHIHHFHAKGAVADEAALEQFQKQWATYQKLVDADALAHKEVGAILHSALAALTKPFAFVDIACGDAGQMRGAIAGTKVASRKLARSSAIRPASTASIATMFETLRS
jgi:hypothetical protein